ncbi:EAL domain-containing protein [Stenotrophomonas sp. 364]|nr:EAL domain-containing protein [Stenotrophomonas sp. 364]
MDDFGSGYSNFAYMTEINVDILKLGESLINNLTTDGRSLLEARAVIVLAHGLGRDYAKR